VPEGRPCLSSCRSVPIVVQVYGSAGLVWLYWFCFICFIYWADFGAIALISNFEETPRGGLILSFSPAWAVQLSITGGIDEITIDENYPDGGKVTSSDYDAVNDQMTAWHPSEYLFEMNLIVLPPPS